MKPHESPRMKTKSIRGDSRDSWPVWNRGIRDCSIRNIFGIQQTYSILYPYSIQATNRANRHELIFY